MKHRNKLLAAILVVGAILAVLCGNSFAKPASSYAKGYCGPAFSSKAQMISWYKSHPVQAAKAEYYVRLHARYYHIQQDQSFISWLTNPHLKLKRAPQGYTLFTNTYCDKAGNVLPYHGKLNVSGVTLMWWCSVTKGPGYNCTPLTKYYCRNFVTGKMAFPASKAHKPKKPKAGPGSIGNCNAINSPGAQVCNTNYIINVCGTQIVIQASSLKDALNQQNDRNQKQCPSAPPAPAPTPTPAPPTNNPPSNPPTNSPPPSGPKTFTATASAMASASATSSATVNCPSGSTTATASASATSSASATASATATSSVSQADANAKAQAKAKAQADSDAKANAKAQADSDAKASASTKCAPAPPPPPANRPPTGNLAPPQHVYVNDTAEVCVDGVSDPDGDPVTVSFGFSAGTAISGVHTQSGGAMCVTYKAPGDTQQVTVTATISDNRGGSITRSSNFPVIPDQF